MYIRCQLGQRGFLIIETLVSPVITKRRWSLCRAFFERCLDLGVGVQNVQYSLQYFCLAMLFDKKMSGCKKHGNMEIFRGNSTGGG